MPAASPARAAQNTSEAGRDEKMSLGPQGLARGTVLLSLPCTPRPSDGPIPQSPTPPGRRVSGEHHLAAACQVAGSQQRYHRTTLKELVPNDTEGSRSGRTSRSYPRKIWGLLLRPPKQAFSDASLGNEGVSHSRPPGTRPFATATCTASPGLGQGLLAAPGACVPF